MAKKSSTSKTNGAAQTDKPDAAAVRRALEAGEGLLRLAPTSLEPMERIEQRSRRRRGTAWEIPLAESWVRD